MVNLLKRYRRATAGNVSVVFASTLFGVLLAAGAAIDTSHKYDREMKLQAAADSAVLAAATRNGTPEQQVAAARDYMAANFASDSSTSAPDVTVTVVNDVISLSAQAAMKTSFMRIVGYEAIPISAHSEAATGGSTVEIALVLDVSGSMRHALSGTTARIDVLKSAARQLVDTVTDNGKRMSRVKIGIVPFNMAVNIGTANSAYVQGAANALFTDQAWAGCVMERPGTGAASDTYVSSSSGSDGKWHAYAWPPEPNGKSGSCLNRSNGTNGGYVAVDPPNGYAVNLRGPNFNCVRHPIMPLSNSYTDVTSRISQLTAEWNQGTIIGPAVSWGLRVLSPGEPFTQGAAYSPKVSKYMIVLTDGEQTTEAEYGTQGYCNQAQNTGVQYKFTPATFGLDGNILSKLGPRDTFSPYGYIRDSDPFQVSPANWTDVGKALYNASLASCAAAKSASKDNPVNVFTIAVSNDAGTGTQVNDLLRKCASSDSNFYLATNDAALTGAFKAIAAKINQVRLTN